MGFRLRESFRCTLLKVSHQLRGSLGVNHKNEEGEAERQGKEHYGIADDARRVEAIHWWARGPIPDSSICGNCGNDQYVGREIEFLPPHEWTELFRILCEKARRASDERDRVDEGNPQCLRATPSQDSTDAHHILRLGLHSDMLSQACCTNGEVKLRQLYAGRWAGNSQFLFSC